MGKILLCLLVSVLLPVSARAFCFQEAGLRYGVSPWLLWAIAKAESDLDPAARNKNRNGTIDIGLMQVNSLWALPLGETWEHLGDPCTNVMAGAWILNKCFQEFGNTWTGVGCYHSRTPERSRRYAARIGAILSRQGVLPDHDSR